MLQCHLDSSRYIYLMLCGVFFECITKKRTFWLISGSCIAGILIAKTLLPPISLTVLTYLKISVKTLQDHLKTFHNLSYVLGYFLAGPNFTKTWSGTVDTTTSSERNQRNVQSYWSFLQYPSNQLPRVSMMDQMRCFSHTCFYTWKHLTVYKLLYYSVFHQLVMLAVTWC